MNMKKQFIVIKIRPGVLPETTFITLPYIEFSSGEEAIQWIHSELSDVLPDNAELDEKALLMGRSCDADSPDEEELEDYTEFEGYYFIFTSGDTHYHILVKDVLL